MSKFKVGDRVKIYHHRTPLIGVVNHITEDGMIKIDLSEVGYIYHPKQCRKLVKKERRRAWIKLTDYGQIDGWASCERHSPGWVEFIEVKKK